MLNHLLYYFVPINLIFLKILTSKDDCEDLKKTGDYESMGRLLEEWAEITRRDRGANTGLRISAKMVQNMAKQTV